MKPEVPNLLHNGDVCRILNVSKRTLQHYRDTSVLPFNQIGHKCYYKREDVEVLLMKSNPNKRQTPMEYETINKETPEMKQLISGMQEVGIRIRKIAQTHRPLFSEKIYLTGREVCERLFFSPTLEDNWDKGILPYPQSSGKILYRLSDLNRILREN